MKKFLLPIAIVIIGYSAWYFVSPLFRDDIVDEEFPTAEEQQMELVEFAIAPLE